MSSVKWNEKFTETQKFSGIPLKQKSIWAKTFVVRINYDGEYYAR
jgi:hypothetical protein